MCWSVQRDCFCWIVNSQKLLVQCGTLALHVQHLCHTHTRLLRSAACLLRRLLFLSGNGCSCSAKGGVSCLCLHSELHRTGGKCHIWGMLSCLESCKTFRSVPVMLINSCTGMFWRPLNHMSLTWCPLWFRSPYLDLAVGGNDRALKQHRGSSEARWPLPLCITLVTHQDVYTLYSIDLTFKLAGPMQASKHWASWVACVAYGTGTRRECMYCVQM